MGDLKDINIIDRQTEVNKYKAIIYYIDEKNDKIMPRVDKIIEEMEKITKKTLEQNEIGIGIGIGASRVIKNVTNYITEKAFILRK